jgi:hypothetical protein
MPIITSSMWIYNFEFLRQMTALISSNLVYIIQQQTYCKCIYIGVVYLFRNQKFVFYQDVKFVCLQYDVMLLQIDRKCSSSFSDYAFNITL